MDNNVKVASFGKQYTGQQLLLTLQQDSKLDDVENMLVTWLSKEGEFHSAWIAKSYIVTLGLLEVTKAKVIEELYNVQE